MYIVCYSISVSISFNFDLPNVEYLIKYDIGYVFNMRLILQCFSMSSYCFIVLHKQQGQTALSIAQKLGYISVVETLKVVTEPSIPTNVAPGAEEKYRVVAPETMQETFMSDSEDEGGKLHVLYLETLFSMFVVFCDAVYKVKVKLSFYTPCRS